MGEVIWKAKEAKKASFKLSSLSTEIKDRALDYMAAALMDNIPDILNSNAVDIDRSINNGRTKAFLDRLKLDNKRIKQMSEGFITLKSLPDPIGEVISMWRRPNGLQIGQKRVPLGVVGIIYEARPNVTADAIGLCLKTGNAVILKGGSDAIESNKAIVSVLSHAAYLAGVPEGSIQLIEDISRESAKQLMKMNGLIDVLIPRGGAGLIRSVVNEATIPVIETGVGNCHIYVDGTADQDMAIDIIINAKTQRPAVCNAVETVLIDKKIAHEFLPKIGKELIDKGVQIRGCKCTTQILPEAIPATYQDWSTEYLDYILAVKIVNGIDEAIDHINHYGTGHSEAIITNDYSKSQRFLEEVDAAAVYVNASTRFTDGFEFGFGAEIGISTQKLHARGPMGLKQLTTIKYIIYGNGQIRD